MNRYSLVRPAVAILFLVGLLFVSTTFAADDDTSPLSVNMGTENGGSIHSSGKVTIKAPTLHELGELMRYDGVSEDNFYRRTLQAAHCEGLEPLSLIHI